MPRRKQRDNNKQEKRGAASDAVEGAAAGSDSSGGRWVCTRAGRCRRGAEKCRPPLHPGRPPPALPRRTVSALSRSSRAAGLVRRFASLWQGGRVDDSADAAQTEGQQQRTIAARARRTGGGAVAGLGGSGSRWVRRAARRTRRGRPSTWSSPSPAPSYDARLGAGPLVPRRPFRASPLLSVTRWQRGRHCRCGTGGKTTTKNRAGRERHALGCRAARGCGAQRGDRPRRRRFHLVIPAARPPQATRPGRGALIPPDPCRASSLPSPRRRRGRRTDGADDAGQTGGQQQTKKAKKKNRG